MSFCVTIQNFASIVVALKKSLLVGLLLNEDCSV